MNLLKSIARLALSGIAFCVFTVGAFAAPRKLHVVILGATKKVPYSKAGDPAGAMHGEDSLSIRALIVDDSRKEWTTGDPHDVTDRSFVVRRAIKLNDALPASEGTGKPGEKSDDKAGIKPAAEGKLGPGEKPSQWVWQRGPWLLVDRVTGHVTALKLPDYDPGVSQPSWFRDYAAYCGVTASGKSLYAVVAQIAARKPVLAKKLGAIDRDSNEGAPVCGSAEWQREPLRITFHPAGRDAASFEIVPGSAVMVEDADDDSDGVKAATQKQ